MKACGFIRCNNLGKIFKIHENYKTHKKENSFVTQK